MFCAGPVNSPGNDLATVSHKVFQGPYFLIINGKTAVGTKTAYLSSRKYLFFKSAHDDIPLNVTARGMGDAIVFVANLDVKLRGRRKLIPRRHRLRRHRRF